MSSATSSAENRIFLENIRWSTYLALLDDLGEHRGRITDRQYLDAAQSTVFPTLPLAEVERFLAMRETTDETQLVRSFRRWVREHFKISH